MDYTRHTFSHPIRTSLPKIASPVPVKHWSNFEAILEWQERTSDALDDGFYSDEPVSTNSLQQYRGNTHKIIEPQDAPAPLSIFNATMRENNRRRDWAVYRKVVEADPNTTIAPPWPPFIAPPSPSPSPEPSIPSLWRDSPSPPGIRRGHCDLTSKTPPLAFANDGYAWWKYVLEAPTSTPSSSRRAFGGPASRSESGALAFGALSDTSEFGTSPSDSSSSGCSLALTTPTGAEDARAVRMELGAAAGAAGPDDDLAACIAQMLLECRVDAELELIEEEECEEEDPLVDGHVYDCGLEKEIRARAAVAQQLNWMLMGMLPTG